VTVPLPKLIGDYFAASNAHDAEAMARAFAADAIVHDERKVHRGRAAITTWARGTIDKYQTTTVPLSVSGGRASTTVKAKVSGTFPGSPIELTFSFEIGDDGIKSLKIG
jgi:ketosteroid isomerase-like protein